MGLFIEHSLWLIGMATDQGHILVGQTFSDESNGEKPMCDACRKEFMVTDKGEIFVGQYFSAESHGYGPRRDACKIDFMADGNGYRPRWDLCRTLVFG